MCVRPFAYAFLDMALHIEARVRICVRVVEPTCMKFRACVNFGIGLYMCVMHSCMRACVRACVHIQAYLSMHILVADMLSCRRNQNAKIVNWREYGRML